MEMDFKQLYYDLNDLLEDICKFLSSEKLANLPQKDKKLAESLIKRSKKQLQEISKIQCTAQNEEYVIMDRKVLVNEEDGKNNTYSSVDDSQEDKSTTTTNRCIPYTDLPAKEAESVKCGYMAMKRKILLGFEKMKRVYANIHNDVLLIYYSEKDSKPVGLIDLMNYTAKENPESNSRNFNLICDTPGQKILHFMAPTREEMMQWVWQINKIHDGLIEPDLESGSSDTVYDVMKQLPSTQKKSNESDELYEELETVKDKLLKSHSNDPTERIEIRPPLPGRILLKKSPIKVPPPVVKPLPKPLSEESVTSYNDIVVEKGRGASVNNSSCSEDDEDNTYEVFAEVKNKIKSLQDAEEGTTMNEQGDNLEDNYEIFSDLKKKMRIMKINNSVDPLEASTTDNKNTNTGEIPSNDLAMNEEQIDHEFKDQLPQSKPKIGIKPLLIKRFQVTLASESN